MTGLIVYLAFLVLSIALSVAAVVWLALTLTRKETRRLGAQVLLVGISGGLCAFLFYCVWYLGLRPMSEWLRLIWSEHNTQAAPWPGWSALIAWPALGFGWAALAALLVLRRKSHRVRHGEANPGSRGKANPM